MVRSTPSLDLLNEKHPKIQEEKKVNPENRAVLLVILYVACFVCYCWRKRNHQGRAFDKKKGNNTDSTRTVAFAFHLKT